METLDQFKLPNGFQPQQPPNTKNRTPRQTGPFVKGPIPLAWLNEVLRMGGRTPLALALALFYQQGLEKSGPIRITSKLRNRFYLESRAVGRTLPKFEEAGLVRVERPPGRCVVVQLILNQPEKEQ